MARWSKEKQAEARRSMLAAARDAFEDVGYEAANLRAIAADAGVAVGTLFNYFPDKLSLLREALYNDLEAIVDRVVEAPPAGTTLEDLGVAFARPFYSYYCERPQLSIVLLRNSLFADGPRENAFRAQVERVGAVMARRLAELRDADRIARDASVEGIVRAFFSHYYFVLMTQLASGDADAMLRQLGNLLRQLEQGVGESSETT